MSPPLGSLVFSKDRTNVFPDLASKIQEVSAKWETISYRSFSTNYLVVLCCFYCLLLHSDLPKISFHKNWSVFRHKILVQDNNR